VVSPALLRLLRSCSAVPGIHGGPAGAQIQRLAVDVSGLQRKP
jgi:hypothetical protein